MYALGIALGVLGAAWHLTIARWRAKQVADGHPSRSWMGLPVGLLGPGLAFYAALSFGGEEAAWTFLVGAVVTTLGVLGYVRWRASE